jgi:hypothetical protein
MCLGQKNFCGKTWRSFEVRTGAMMKCNDVLDILYGHDEPLSLGKHAAFVFHIVFCRRCAAALKHWQEAEALLQNGFPPSPDFTEAVMKLVYDEEEYTQEDAAFAIPGGVSTRGWVIVGFIVLVSLSTLVFGGEFTSLVLGWGASFLLPLGITIGILITGYGALFIGSHLKELSVRFNLKV